jgi:hypothetical protein
MKKYKKIKFSNKREDYNLQLYKKNFLVQVVET